MTKADDLRKACVAFYHAGYSADFTIDTFAFVGFNFSRASLYRWVEQLRSTGQCNAVRSRAETIVTMDPLHFAFIEHLLRVFIF